MAINYPKGKRPETIHCEFCGEDYAASYKRCPFCDEQPVPEGEDDEEGGSMKGRRHPSNNTRGGGYGSTSPLRIVGAVVSVALIVAAVIIVITIVQPMITKGKTTIPSAPPQTQMPVSPSPSATPDPVVSPQVSPAGTPGPVATNFTLSSEDFTLKSYNETATLRVKGTATGVTFASDKPTVASVDAATGKVTGLSRGQAVITATASDGGTRTCIVRCAFDGPAGNTTTKPGASTPPSAQPSKAPGGTSTGTLTLNRTDFTMGKASEKFQMKVTGTTATATWSTDNASVATISTSGVVTAVGKGRATITCTVDGKTITCIVRCNF